MPQEPHFTGRRQQLLELAASLKESQPVIIGGPAGIGRSALANAFAHRYGRYFAGGVFRISFAHPDAIRAQLVACGHAMRLSPTFESYPRLEQEYKVDIIDDEVVEEE